MNELTIFSKDNFSVRTVSINDEPYFVAKDVAEMLGYSETNRMTERLDSDEKMSTKIVGISATNPNVTVINESGLYSAILGSNKPEAKAFKKWITSEVLPSIRKNGLFATDSTIENMIANPDFAIQLLQNLKDEKAKRIEAERTKAQISDRQTATALARASVLVRENRALKEQLVKNFDYLTITAVCKKTKKAKSFYSFRLLKEASAEMGYDVLKVKDDRYGDVNSYHRDVWQECYDYIELPATLHS